LLLNRLMMMMMILKKKNQSKCVFKLHDDILLDREYYNM
jgi:hypothetical protein